MTATPKVVIVGRPNVGKSTLVNRIVGRREAIVEERPGVTRDRKEVEADWRGYRFVVVDTGGWLAKGSDLDGKVSRQAESAITEADVVLFVTDATTGVTEEDDQMARRLRGAKIPLLLVANKVDDDRHQAAAWELVRLGLGQPYPVSAIHGGGVGNLLDEVVKHLPEPAAEPATPSEAAARRADRVGATAGGPAGPGIPHGPGGPGAADPLALVEEAGETGSAPTTDGDNDNDPAASDHGGHTDGEARVFGIAIVGRPNVGKSTLFNRMIGEERAVVHDLPGTTRDTIDTVVETADGPVRFLDTAGMRRRSRIDDDTEYYSVVRALKAVDTADVALLVIDASEGVTQQDQRLAERVDAAGCPIVVVLNKVEMLTTDQKEDLTLQIARRLSFLPGVPVHRITALSGKGVHKLLPSLTVALGAYQARVPTRKVNDVIRSAQAAHPAPGGARVLYAAQGATDPPTFTLFANRALPPSYLRYLERKLREALDLGPTPIKLRVRRRSA